MASVWVLEMVGRPGQSQDGFSDGRRELRINSKPQQLQVAFQDWSEAVRVYPLRLEISLWTFGKGCQEEE